MKVPSRIAVIWLGLFVLGIGFGVMVASHGLPWWLAPVISAVVFAGSVEFLLVGMLAASMPLAAIAATTLLVNARHLFYGLTFPLQRVRGRIAKAYSVYALCDEAYALITTAPTASLTSRRIVTTQLGLHASWAVGSLVGGLAGGAFLRDVPGIDFVLTALFVVLALDAFKENPDRATVALAATAAAVGLVVAPSAMLLVSMGVFAALLVTRHLVTRREQETVHA